MKSQMKRFFMGCLSASTRFGEFFRDNLLTLLILIVCIRFSYSGFGLGESLSLLALCLLFGLDKYINRDTKDYRKDVAHNLVEMHKNLKKLELSSKALAEKLEKQTMIMLEIESLKVKLADLKTKKEFEQQFQEKRRMF